MKLRSIFMRTINKRVLLPIILFLLLLSLVEYYRFCSGIENSLNKEIESTEFSDIKVEDFDPLSIFENIKKLTKIELKYLYQKIYYSPLMRVIHPTAFQMYEEAPTLDLYIKGKEQVYFIDNQKEKNLIPYFSGQINSKCKINAIYISESDDTSKVKLSSIGKNADHYELGRGWSSFKIIFGKENNHFGRKAKKNILVSSARHFERDAFANSLFKNLCDGICIESNPILPIINGQKKYGFLIEDSWDKYLIEKNRRRDGSIFTTGYNYKKVENTDTFLNISHSSGDLSRVRAFADSLMIKKIPLAMIDTVKLNCMLLLCYDFFGGHPLINMNLHWYSNPVSGLMEPTLREAEFKGQYSVYLNNSDISFASDYMSRTKFNLGRMRQRYYTNLEINKVLEDLEYWSKSLSNETLSDIAWLSHTVDSLQRDPMKTTYINLSEDLDTIYVNSTLTIDSLKIFGKNQCLVIEDGARFEFTDKKSVMIIKGPIVCRNKDECNFRAKNGGSIYFTGDDIKLLKNLHFEGFSALDNYGYSLPSALTFYETKVIIDSCKFEKNIIGDDMINTFRCKSVSIRNSQFESSYADAFDSDFCNLFFDNCIFKDSGNDALDVSGSTGSVWNSNFTSSQDKAVSAGENSNLSICNSSFQMNELAVVAKDGSSIEIKDTHFSDNRLDIAAYRKKLEYPEAKLFIDHNELLTVLIEEGVITNFECEKVKNISSVMYGNQYGKASKR